MQLRTFMGIVCLAGAVALSTGSLSAAAPSGPPCACASRAEERNFPKEASRLLQEIRSAASWLTDHASKLESLTRSGSSWQSHASEWTLARERINFIGKQIQLLREIRSLATPAQQEAFESIVPFAATAAAHGESAIRHLNENRGVLWAESYRAQVKGITESANQMKKTVGLHLEIEDAQNRLDSLREEAAAL